MRVLIVEDSATVRAHLKAVLSSDSDIEVVGEVADGKSAIDLCESLRPDVITMDMMLPVMSGLAATEYIMAHCPTPILIVSASTNRGELFKTYEALAAGAVDVLDKSLAGGPDGSWEREFITTVKIVSRVSVVTHPTGRLKQAFSRFQLHNPSTLEPSSVLVAAIGASTGGPAAIVEILHGLPKSFDIPLLLVIHISQTFASSFADWLDGVTPRRVTYARDGQPVVDAAGRVIMAPADQHLIVRNGRLWLSDAPERHSCRPSVDVLFESVAEEYGANAAACLLTGMGCDGASGLLDIHKSGGFTIAQDEETSVVYGMPREAVQLGAAQHILPITEIAPMLCTLQGVS